MTLWTIQPEAIYQEILNTGVYRCDFQQSHMREWQMQYDWLVAQMEQRIGKRPKGVSYPVWAWYQREGRRKKPDLRQERWGNGWKGDRFVCMEVEIPDELVLLSDFDGWSIILLDSLISETKEEDDTLSQVYSSLSTAEQKEMMERNWERVFDLSPMNHEWTARGETIQATFWELRKEQIRKTWLFTSATPKPSYLETD